MTKEYNDYKYCDPEDGNSKIYIYKIINYGNFLFEFFRNVADDIPHDVPGKGKFTCNYHY